MPATSSVRGHDPLLLIPGFVLIDQCIGGMTTRCAAACCGSGIMRVARYAGANMYGFRILNCRFPYSIFHLVSFDECIG